MLVSCHTRACLAQTQETRIHTQRESPTHSPFGCSAVGSGWVDVHLVFVNMLVIVCVTSHYRRMHSR